MSRPCAFCFPLLSIRGCVGVAGLALTTALAQAASAPHGDPTRQHLWKSVPDEVYLEESGEKIITEKPVTALGIQGSTLSAVVGEDLKRLVGAAFEDVAGAPKGLRRLRSLGQGLWGAAQDGAYRFAGQTWIRIDTNVFTDFCLHLGQVYGAT